MVPPPGFDDMTIEEFVEMLQEELELREMDLRLQHAAAGRVFLGPKGVLEQDRYAYPSTLEPRRTLSPRVGAKNKWRRIEALRRLVGFAREHAEALARYIRGERDVLFPPDTYWARVHLGVSCLAAG
jgi:hypothetical protein